MSKRQILVRFVATALVVVAGTAVVGRAAGLGVSSDKLSAVSATLPICASGSVGLTITHSGGDVKTITPKLTTCTGAVANDYVYVTVEETTAHVGYQDCELTGATDPSCAVTLTGTVPYAAGDSYSIVVVAEPSATGTASKSTNGMGLVSEYLTLRTCTATGTALNAGTTC